MYIGNNDNSEKVDINKLMNVVKHLEDKWELVGNLLLVPKDELNSIYSNVMINRKDTCESFKKSTCAIKVLTYWLRNSEDISVTAFIKAISAPYAGLGNRIEAVKDALKSVPSKGSISDRPNTHKQSDIDMMADYCSELSKSCKLEDVLVFVKLITGKGKKYFNDIDDFGDLMLLLQTYGYLSSADLSLLKKIADHFQCIKGLNVIEKYETQQPLVNKTTWSHHHTSHPKEAFVVGRVDIKPEDATLKHTSNAKSVVCKLTNIDQTDAFLDHAEVGSVILHWKIVNKRSRLTLPKTITPFELKECKASGLTHIGIMTDGNLKMKKIDELQGKMSIIH